MTDPTGDLAGAVEQTYNHLFEVNSALIAATRKEIQDLTAIRDTYLFQVEQVQQAIDLLVMTIDATAKATGDLLLAEHGLTREEEDEDPED